MSFRRAGIAHLHWLLLFLVLATASAAAQNPMLKCAPGVTDGVPAYVSVPPRADFLPNTKLHCGTAISGSEEVADGWSRVWIGSPARQYYVHHEALRQPPPVNPLDILPKPVDFGPGPLTDETKLHSIAHELVQNIIKCASAKASGIPCGCFFSDLPKP